jgi:hypothetical protein
VSRGIWHNICSYGLYGYYMAPEQDYSRNMYGHLGWAQEQAYNQYQPYDNPYKDATPEQVKELLDGLRTRVNEEETRRSLRQDDFRAAETSGPISDRCQCRDTCGIDLVYGSGCKNKADQEDGLCTACRGYRIMRSETGGQDKHCHGCNWGMGFGHYSEARTAEDIWSPKHSGAGEPDLDL